MNLYIKNYGGYFNCKSTYFRAHCTCSEYSVFLHSGTNFLYGDIESEGFSLSYLLSMSMCKSAGIVCDQSPEIEIDGNKSDIKNTGKFACYVDKIYPLFNIRKKVNVQVKKGLKKSKIKMTTEDVRTLFNIAPQRYNRSLKQVGSDIYRCLAAIAFANNKSIYCFPWVSHKMYRYYETSFLDIFKVLDSYNKIIIFPTNADVDYNNGHVVDIKWAKETGMYYSQVLSMLDCNQSKEIQAKGIELANELKDINAFIQPLFLDENKNVWKNCIEVISKRSDQELILYANVLLERLQDFNYPNALKIIERLKK